ncbi:MAG: type II toxin-antitoxin system VapB family antitoxin [Verrucomicrobiota bacterium]|nr:type II toxin-antitoxin system VapB family antitoxin [Verrucomicrobiota bacterium]
MRTTLNIDDHLYASAAESTGIKEKTALVRLALGNPMELSQYAR